MSGVARIGPRRTAVVPRVPRGRARRDLGRNGVIDLRFSVKDSLKNHGAGTKTGHDSCQSAFTATWTAWQEVNLTLISDPQKELQA